MNPSDRASRQTLAAILAGAALFAFATDALAQQRPQQQRQPPRPASIWERLVQANQEGLPVARIGNDSRVTVPEDPSIPERVALIAPTDQARAGEFSAYGVTVRWAYGPQPPAPPTPAPPSAGPGAQAPAQPVRPGQPAPPAAEPEEPPAPPAPALTVEVLREGAVVATRTTEVGAAPLAAVQIVHMDPRRIRPQVLFYVVSAEGQTTAHAAVADAAGTAWAFQEVPGCCNGPLHKVLARDVDGDGTDEIVDTRFFGGDIEWESEAYTLTATPRVISMVNGEFQDATFEERYQDVLARRLAEWFEESETLLRGRPTPASEEWRAMAIGYVAIKATLGEFEDGWRFLIGDGGLARESAFLQRVLRGLVDDGLVEEGTTPPAPPAAPARPAARR